MKQKSTGPPGVLKRKGPGRSPANPGPRVKKLVRRRSYRDNPHLARLRQPLLLLSRYAKGLLQPFTCFGCGQKALDPIGWDGPQKPLCETCADGGPL